MSKSLKITSGLKLNIGKKSISTTIGKRGFSINTGTNGTFVNITIPHTGIRCRKKLCTTKHKTKYFKHYQPHRNSSTEGIVFLSSIIGGTIFFIFNSILWSLVIAFLISMLGIIASYKDTQKR